MPMRQVPFRICLQNRFGRHQNREETILAHVAVGRNTKSVAGEIDRRPPRLVWPLCFWHCSTSRFPLLVAGRLHWLHVVELHLNLVEYDDFTVINASTQFPRPFGVGFPRGSHDRKARHKTLQVQAQMALGRRPAPPGLGPSHAGGDQRNRRRVHHRDRAFEFTRQSFSVEPPPAAN